MSFNPELIRNQIMPGNTYRVHGSVYGWGDDGYDDGENYFTVFSWSEFIIEAKKRGMRNEIINGIIDHYMIRDKDEYPAFVPDVDSVTFMTYNKYGEVTSNPESPYRLLTI